MFKRITNRTWDNENKVYVYTLEGGRTWVNAVYYELGATIKIS